MSYILQARQKNSNSVINNGVWDTILRENATLKLDKGDSLILHSAFIDTQETNSNRIILNEDTQLRISYYIYDILTDTTDKTYITTNLNADGEPYLLYYGVGAEVPSGYSYIDYFTFKIGFLGGHWIDYDGTIYYEYINTVGEVVKASVSMPPTKGDRTTEKIFINIIAKDKSFKIHKYDITPPGGNPRDLDAHIAEIPDANHYEPVLGVAEIIIEKGEYTPQHIANIINDKMTNTRNVANLNNNTLLKTTDEFFKSGVNKEYYFMNNGGFNIYKYNDTSTENPPYSYILGSSQFGLIYDEEKNKFVFNYLHTPNYKGGTGTDAGAIIVEWKNPVDNGQTLTDTRYMYNKYGGIIINNMEPANFWIDKLGLDLTNSSLNFINKSITVGSEDYKYNAPNNLKEGLNMTGGYYSVDDFIYKAQTNPRKYSKNEIYKSTTEDTFIIYSDKQFLSNTTQDEPYFIIETNLADNRLYTESGIVNLSGIVSRYYGYNNFTSAGSEAGLIYTHQGETPITINNIRVRILNPDLTPSEQLGPENTLFLQVVKNPELNK